ncbi:FtsK/SpoIIIE family protein [Brochothrix thermosphacta DSM 20171 = FSL F6-1036]|nr:FtsK/SpoIIIE family protein [Brochothrix thermosphacta DSM 20171 = FSL F6-1036]
MIILAIFGMGQFGFVGRFLFEMSVVLAGTFAGVLLILIGLLGIHFIVKRKWPALLKPHFLGVFFYVVCNYGYLSYSHCSTAIIW